MYFFALDESNTHNGIDYFVFGGIVVTDSVLVEISEKIKTIKKTCLTDKVLPPELEIKWNYEQTNAQLKKSTGIELTKEEHKKLKGEILTLIASYSRNDLGMCVYLSPTEFYQADGWFSYVIAMNKCIDKFEKLLSSRGDTGTVLIDTLTGVKTKNEKGELVSLDTKTIQRKLTIYVLQVFESGTGKSEIKHINGIVPNISSIISPLHQVNDIVLGAFQYYLKYHTAPASTPAREIAVSVMKNIVKNFYVNFEGSNCFGAINSGLLIYPIKLVEESCSGKIKDLKVNLWKDFGIK